MANDTEVMRQFLVSLGFKIDEVQQRKFDETVLKTDKTIMSLGKTLFGIAASAQALVIGFATSFERLYYLSQRTGTSVSDIKAASFAGRQIGLNAEAIEQTINNLSRNVKANPGLEALIGGLTGKPVAGRGMAKVLEDIIGSLSKMPDFVAFQYAGQFGIDPDTYLQLKNNLSDYLDQEDRQRKIWANAGVDVDNAKTKMRDYMRTLRELGEESEAVGAKLAISLEPAFKSITKALSDAMTGISHFIDWATSDKPIDHTHQHYVAGKLRGGVGGHWEDNRRTAPSRGGGINAEVWDGNKWVPEGTAHSSRMSAPNPITFSSSRGGAMLHLPRNLRNNNPANIEYGDFARRNGAVGSDGRFAIFPTLEAGKAAQRALLMSKYNRGLNTITKLIRGSGNVDGWLGHGKDLTDATGYIADLSRATGFDPNHALSASDLTTLMAAQQNHEGATVNQTNNITVHGASDPQATGRAVLGAQSKVTADIVRNLRGAHG